MQELHFTGQTEELRACLSYLSKDMDFQMAETGVEVCVAKQESGGLKVEISETGCKITYGCIPDFCRSLCILLDTLQKGEKAFSIEESREIEHCGIMVDLSRNAVFKLETAKDFISRIARMGMNTFMLYIENIYKMEEYPYFGYMRGAYSEEELKEMDAFISECLKSTFSSNNKEAINIKGLEEFLYIPTSYDEDEDLDSEAYVGNPTGILKDEGVSPTTDIPSSEDNPTINNISTSTSTGFRK